MKSQYFVTVLSLVWLIDQTQSYMWGFAPISTTVPPHNETVDSGGVEISNGKNMDGNNNLMDDETLRLHWLDFQIKRQIGFPSVSDITEPINIPTVLRDAMEREQTQREQAIPTQDNDIKSIFIYGTKHESCRTNLNYQHSCLEFNVSTTISPFDIADAELWVYKLRTDQNATFRVQDIVNVRHPKKESYFATKSAPQEEGWVKFTDNVRKTVKQWLHREHRDRPHVLDIACTDLSVECHENPIALTGPNKPFLLLTMGASAKRRHQRAKRQLQFCPPQMGCCLQSWEVDFSAYPLFKYIEYPRNFRPNYCKGDCNLFPQDIPQGNIRSSILREAGKESCCYPSKFTKQSVIYRDGSGMFISRELDLIVTECSCK